jgi:hypothetical protein
MATTERCERTDLLTNQCAHCRGDDQQPTRDSRMRTSKPFEANYRSPCGGADDIEPGEQIVMYAGEAWHVECAEEDGAVVPSTAPRARLEDPYG